MAGPVQPISQYSFVEVCAHCIMWCIWGEWNARSFENASILCTGLNLSSFILCSSGVQLYKHFHLLQFLTCRIFVIWALDCFVPLVRLQCAWVCFVFNKKFWYFKKNRNNIKCTCSNQFGVHKSVTRVQECTLGKGV